MLLACDIGNTKVKAGLFSKDKLLETYSFKGIEMLRGIYSQKNISSTGISSVVPEISDLFIKFLDANSFRYHLVSSRSRFNLSIKYKTPETLGTDRICSAEGAYALNRKMKKDEILLSVDFGTATTINIIHYPGEFNGGVIAPGISMMAEALHSNTAQLPLAGFTEFDGMIGDSTKSSIASGLINSALGMIQRILDFLQNTYQSKKIKIFITGGNAEKFLPYIEFDFTYEKDLVLYGIKTITNLNLPD
jgi:type III pantothenate kinase